MELIDRKSKIIIGQGRVLPMWLRLTLTAFNICLVFLLFSYEKELGNLVAIGFFVLTGIVPAYWTARRILKIDLDGNSWTNYVWIMGFKVSQEKWENHHFEEIVVKKQEHRAKAYLMTRDNQKVFLLSRETAMEVQEKLKDLGLTSSVPLKSI